MSFFERKQFRFFYVSLILFVVFFSFSAHAASGVPSAISYQGKLTDSGGNALGGAGTSYYFKFSFWDNATVGSGTKLWPSTSPTALPLTVKQGVFNVDIGDTSNGYPDTLDYNWNTNSRVYLQVEISSDNTNWETLSPRSSITSSAFSQVASQVSGTADSSFGTTTPITNSLISAISTAISKTVLTIRGIAGQVANLFNIQDSSGNPIFSVGANGNTGIGTSTPANKLDVWGNLNVATGTTPALFVNTGTGRVGIGTTTPSFALDVLSTSNLSTARFYNPTPTTGKTQVVIRQGAGNVNGSSLEPVLVVQNPSGTRTAFIRGDGVIGSANLGTLDDYSAMITDSSVGSTNNPQGLNFGNLSVLNWGANQWWSTRDLGVSRYASGVLAVGNGKQGDYSGTLIAGNIGIGTTSPQYAFDLTSSAATSFCLRTSAGTCGASFNPSQNGGAGLFSTNYLLTTAAYLNSIDANGVSSDMTIGPTSNRSLYLRTNNLTRLAINNSGNVGIGTTSPSAKLDVWGNLNVGTSSTPTLFANTATGKVGIGTNAPAYGLDLAQSNAINFQGTNNYIQFNDYNWQIRGRDASPPFTRAIVGTYSMNMVTGAGLGEGFAFGRNGGNSIVEIVNDGRFYLNGLMGIGTTTPGASLQINPSSASTIGQIIKGFASQTADLFQIQDATGTPKFKIDSSYKLNLGTASGAASSTFGQVYFGTDPGNSSSAPGATFITAGSGGVGRLYFGDSTHPLYSVNFSNVSVVESFPASLDMQSLSENGQTVSKIKSALGADLVLSTSAETNAGYITGPTSPTSARRSMAFRFLAADSDSYKRNAGFVFTSATSSAAWTSPHTIWSTVNETNPLMTLTMGGSLGIGTTTPGASLQINPSSASTIGQIIKGFASQTADWFKTQDSSGNDLINFNQFSYVGTGTTSPANRIQIKGTTGADSSTGLDLFVARDDINPTINASYITPGSGRRLFFGKSGATATLNLVNVTGIESMPSYQLAPSTNAGAGTSPGYYNGIFGDLAITGDYISGSGSGNITVLNGGSGTNGFGGNFNPNTNRTFKFNVDTTDGDNYHATNRKTTIGQGGPAIAWIHENRAFVYKTSFTGSGVNDAIVMYSTNSENSGTGHTYDVKITSTGAPDQFAVSVDGGAYGSNTAITGASQTINNGVRIKFTATTGHTLNDITRFTSYYQTQPFMAWGLGNTGGGQGVTPSLGDAGAYTLMTLGMGGTLNQTLFGATTVGHIIQQYTGSTADFLQLKTSTGTTTTVFSSAGWLGLGTSTPTAQLHTTGTVRFGALTGAGANLIVDANGNVTVSSDERLKNIQGDFTRGLSDLANINPILYKWKSETGYDASSTYAGFSAQNIQANIPEAVATDTKGFLTLADRPILATLVNAVKELGSVFVKVENGVAYLKDLVTSSLTSNEICLQDASGKTCITKTQLDKILQNTGTSGSAAPTQTTSSVSTTTDTSTSDTNSTSTIVASTSDPVVSTVSTSSTTATPTSPDTSNTVSPTSSTDELTATSSGI